MTDLFETILTALLAFMVADYTLSRLVSGNPPKPLVGDVLRAVIAAVFAVLLVVIAGVLILKDIIN
jgi:hypothetical protein